MPSYDYVCGSCEHTFDKQLKISERDVPTTEPCPVCGVSEVTKTLVRAPDWSDGVRGKSSVSGGFRDVLEKVHRTNPHSNLSQKYNLS